MGFPTDMFVVLFMIPRLSGWLAHWLEQLDDKEGKIVRPRQIYAGYTSRDYDAAKKVTVKTSMDYVDSKGPAIKQASC
jgi:citrate synthase